jgi:hypothetical protein
MRYDYCDADGYERGDMGKGRPKTKRIYRLEHTDTKNQLAHVKGRDIWGAPYTVVLPMHTLTKLDPVIER